MTNTIRKNFTYFIEFNHILSYHKRSEIRNILSKTKKRLNIQPSKIEGEHII